MIHESLHRSSPLLLYKTNELLSIGYIWFFLYLGQFTERMLQKTLIFLPKKKKIISIVIIVTLICVCPFNHKEEEYPHCVLAWVVDVRLQRIVLSYSFLIIFFKDFKASFCWQIFMNSQRHKIPVTISLTSVLLPCI